MAAENAKNGDAVLHVDTHLIEVGHQFIVFKFKKKINKFVIIQV